MERAELLETDFSTADADCPAFTFEGSELVVRFNDWQEKAVVVTFAKVCGVRWQETESGPQPRDDSTYEILESDWLETYRKQNILGTSEVVRHFKLCFNARGTLDVLATSFRLVT